MRENEEFIVICMELVEGTNLKKYLESRILEDLPLTDLECSQIMKGIIQGVGYIHSKDFIHRDLKLENVMLTSPHELESIKIIDFGLSAFFKREMYHTLDERCGTLIYMAPEQAMNKRYGKVVYVL